MKCGFKSITILCPESRDKNATWQNRILWVQNVMRVLGKSVEEAVELEAKIQPYTKALDNNH